MRQGRLCLALPGLFASRPCTGSSQPWRRRASCGTRCGPTSAEAALPRPPPTGSEVSAHRREEVPRPLPPPLPLDPFPSSAEGPCCLKTKSPSELGELKKGEGEERGGQRKASPPLPPPLPRTGEAPAFPLGGFNLPSLRPDPFLLSPFLLPPPYFHRR